MFSYGKNYSQRTLAEAWLNIKTTIVILFLWLRNKKLQECKKWADDPEDEPRKSQQMPYSIVPVVNTGNRPSEMFLGKEVFWKYTANLQQNTHTKVWFQYYHIEITFNKFTCRHGCSPVNLLQISRIPFS